MQVGKVLRSPASWKTPSSTAPILMPTNVSVNVGEPLSRQIKDQLGTLTPHQAILDDRGRFHKPRRLH